MLVNKMLNLVEKTEGQWEYERAVAARADRWVPACGGLEVTQESHAGRYLYVYNPGRHEHGWLNLNTDIVEMESPYNV